MRMWELREPAEHSKYKMEMYEERIKEAYKCGYDEGYMEAMNELEDSKLREKTRYYMKEYKYK